MATKLLGSWIAPRTICASVILRNEHVTSARTSEANRRKALESIGPKTQEEKAVVRLIALGHGLLSREVLLPGVSLKKSHSWWLVSAPPDTYRGVLWPAGGSSLLPSAVLASIRIPLRWSREKIDAKGCDRWLRALQGGVGLYCG
jgi:hypothetical protein